MIKESLQQTIIEYEQKKQRLTSTQQKLVFRWKVIALILCILSIVLLGLLTQLLKQFKNEQTLKYNTTFLPQLLGQSQQLKSMSQIKNLIHGINTSQRVRFKSCIRLNSFKQISSQLILQSINLKHNLLYIISLKDSINSYKFGMLLRQQFDYKIIPTNNIIQITDPDDDKSSVMFNLQKDLSLKMNLDMNCKLYSYDLNGNGLVIMESLNLQKNSKNQIQVKIANHQCFGKSQKKAIEQFKAITGIQLNSLQQSKMLEIQNIQIFHLEQIGQTNLQF